MRKIGLTAVAVVAAAMLGTVALGAVQAPAAAQNTARTAARAIAGTWSGDVAGIPVVLRIKRSGAGWTATLDSPKQHAFGLPTTNFAWRPPSLTFTLPAAHASYTGVMNAAGEIRGTWTQGGGSLPLTFHRGAPHLTRAKPFQMPPGVRQIQVAIATGPGEGELAGTISEPAAQPPAHGWPGAVIIAGSGPTDRNGNNSYDPVRGNIYAKLAAYLSDHGVVVLRYDKRGVGGSRSALLPRHVRRYATDARWAARRLMRQPGVNPRRITLIGHSLGSTLALMAADQTSPPLPVRLAGIVSLEGAGRTLAAVVRWQEQGMYRRAADHPAALAARKRQIASLNASLDKTRLGRSLLRLDPLAAARRDPVPTLVIQGGKDIQVTAALDARPLAAAIPATTPHELKIFPNMTHMLEDYAGRPGTAEYLLPADTPLDPGMLRATLAWVNNPGAASAGGQL